MLPSDQIDLQVSLEQNNLVLRFNPPVTWISLPQDAAIQLAQNIFRLYNLRPFAVVGGGKVTGGP